MARKIKLKSLRRKTITVFTLLFIILIFSIYLLLNTIMMNSINMLERKNINENMNRIINTVDLETSNLSTIAQDWGAWDDTYRFIEDGNKDFIEANLPEDVLLNLKLNLMIFIDQSGKYVFAKGMNFESEEFVPVYPQLQKTLEKSHIFKNTDPNYKLEGIIMLPEGPMLIASYPIIKSDFKGPVLGNIVIGRFLDDVMVKDLSDRVKLELSLKRLDQKNQNYVKSSNHNQESSIEVQELSKDKITAYTILQDIYNQPALSLSVEMDRDVSLIGKKGITYMLYSLIAVGSIFTITVMLFLEKNILSRLLKLSKEVLNIGNSGEFSKRLDTQKKQDEIFILSDGINNMLDKLEESEYKIKESELLQLEVAKREKIQERIKYLAYHDHLTGLPNRLLFVNKLKKTIAISKPLEKPLGVIFVDLDGFKMVNDTLGHHKGDELLKQVAHRLVASLGEDDIVSRVGGDEFIIMIQNFADLNEITETITKIIDGFKQRFKLDNKDIYVTASLGVAQYPIDGEDVDTLLKNADIAMYKAKENGKNQYALCTPVMRSNIMETMTLTNSLYDALERNEFMVYYQPQVSSITGKIIGLEALLRWNHPVLGFIPPSKFIPLAEQTGLILPIGDWVLRTACKQNKVWQDAGLPHLRMAVNLSMVQFQNPNIVKQVEEILLETGLDPEYLELEITESIAMNEVNCVIETLNSFKKLGITISIDDFGTEYSSLSRLKQMPIDKIKIAMSFIHGISISDKDEAITKAIIVLAKNLGLNIIAEGVETEDQLSFLSHRMCDEIQGFYYYKPMPAQEVELILLNDNIVEIEG